MPHGTPDFWGADPKSTTYVLQDDAELAVRLGSPVNFDRRGDVYDITTWYQGWGCWQRDGFGAGNASYISASFPQVGSVSSVLRTGGAIDDWFRLTKYLPFPALGGLGLQVSFIPVANTREVWLQLVLDDGITQKLYGSRYNHQTGTVEVLHSDVAYHVVGAPGVMATGMGNYVIMKMVADASLIKHTRVLFNGATYPSLLYSGLSGASVTPRTMKVILYVYTAANAPIEVPVGHVIITQNEPV